MDLLRQMPRDNDLYWCARPGKPLEAPVRDLLRDVDGCLIEVDSFDRAMNDIRDIVGFDVPRMLGSLEGRQEEMIDRIKKAAPPVTCGYIYPKTFGCPGLDFNFL